MEGVSICVELVSVWKELVPVERVSLCVGNVILLQVLCSPAVQRLNNSRAVSGSLHACMCSPLSTLKLREYYRWLCLWCVHGLRFLNDFTYVSGINQDELCRPCMIYLAKIF